MIAQDVLNNVKEWAETTGGEGSEAAQEWSQSVREVVAFPSDSGEWGASLEEAFEAGRRYEAGLRGVRLYAHAVPLDSDCGVANSQREPE